MFIQVDTQVEIEDLIKGMIVQSGNDACVALAEAISGSEDNFAQMMNREAQRLGMKASSFRNSAGMPDPQHYTTARDLAILAGALIRDFPDEYAKYYSLKEFRYNKITQPNRNRLLWLDPTVDGVKTGHTDGAGSVSYTHLDVYKRQCCGCPLVKPPADTKRPPPGPSARSRSC